MTSNLKLNFSITTRDYSPHYYYVKTEQEIYRPQPLTAHPALAQKISTVPSVCLDTLHPQERDPHPHVEYVDEGLWKSRILFQRDRSWSVFQSQCKANAHRTQGLTHPSLEALCDHELKRRYPNYRLITGVKARFKNIFPTLAKILMGEKRFFQELTQKEENKYKRQIAYSAINRDDLICQPKIEDAELRDSLHLTDDSVLQTEHRFAKNSPMNGQSYVLDGETVSLSQAIACSSDRYVENTGNLRVVQTKHKESLCYTGRVDSERKALEQASFIFFNELNTNRKGITQSKDANHQDIYQLDYVVNSMLSSPWALNGKLPVSPFPERQYLENELKALAQLKQQGPITIEDPNFPGRTYRVQFNPIVFSRPVNIFARVETWLPSFFTGASRSQEISQEGFVHLETLARRHLSILRQQNTCQLSTEKRRQLHFTVQSLERTLLALEQHHKDPYLRPEEEMLFRDYLCKLLRLPCVYHCKSSTDRTSPMVALSSALQQWMDLKLPLPEDIRDLLKDWRFKELFASNWMAGHQITRYARGGKGTIAGHSLNPHNLGLALSRGITQNPTIAPLLPERYLKDYPLSKKITAIGAYTLLSIPLIILFYLPLTLVTAARHLGWAASLGTKKHWLGPTRFTLPMLPLTLLFNFASILPSKVLNEHSPQIGERQLIAGGKKGGKEDNQ
jgi:hypothetical protein